MVRKAFLLLWMTIWPIVALFPALVTGPTAKQPPGDTNAAVTLAQNLSEESKAPVEISENLPDIEKTNTPQLATSGTAASETPVLRGPEFLDPSSQPVSVAIDRSDASAAPTTRESLPLPSVSSRKGEAALPIDTVPRSIRRTSPALTAQEEQARKLIHERAQLRAQQRHARLEIKYRRTSGIVPVSTAARWHAQLTQRN